MNVKNGFEIGALPNEARRAGRAKNSNSPTQSWVETITFVNVWLN